MDSSKDSDATGLTEPSFPMGGESEKVSLTWNAPPPQPSPVVKRRIELGLGDTDTEWTTLLLIVFL